MDQSSGEERLRNVVFADEVYFGNPRPDVDTAGCLLRSSDGPWTCLLSRVLFFNGNQPPLSTQTSPMSSPDESEPSFFKRVWDVVARIPPGRVTTYGDIAKHLGRRGAAQLVGWALNEAAGSGLPCHRVVNRNGRLTGKRHFETPHVMEERLRSEGVEFVDDDQVDLDRYHWMPGRSED